MYLLEEHGIGAERFPGHIYVFHDGLSRSPGLSLDSPGSPPPLDIYGSEGAHVSREHPLPGHYCSLRHGLVFLDSREPGSKVGETQIG